MRALDQWIRKGLHHARQHRDGNWQATYDEAPVLRFLTSMPGLQAPNLVLGVLGPSRDEKGRVYPFVVACEIPQRAVSFHHVPYLPVRGEPFFAAAQPLVRRATAGDVPPAALSTQVEALDVAVPLQSTVPHQHKRYLQRETMGSFADALFGHFEDDKKYRLFHTLFEVLLPLRNQTAPSIDDGLQFPLLSDEDARLHVVSFWLDVVVRLLGEMQDPPSIFWPVPDATAEFLQLVVGEGSSAALVQGLVPPDDETAGVLGSGGDGSTAEMTRSVPEDYEPLLENEHLRLWDFLRRL